MKGAARYGEMTAQLRDVYRSIGFEAIDIIFNIADELRATARLFVSFLRHLFDDACDEGLNKRLLEVAYSRLAGVVAPE
jgi:hypothetical protein